MSDGLRDAGFKKPDARREVRDMRSRVPSRVLRAALIVVLSRIPNPVSRILYLAALAILLALCASSFAHESRPAYLEINETVPGRYNVLWRTPLNAGMRLPVLLRFPEEVRNITEPSVRELPDSIVERRLIEVSGSGLAGRRIDFVGLQGTITDVLVRVQMADGSFSTRLVRPSQAWVEIAAAQGALAVASTYIVHGIEHISFGVDHLLFV